MWYVACISTGTGSALSADRLVQRYGLANVTFRMEHTKVEDPDNYRFHDDLFRIRWPGARVLEGCDGRTPWQVAEGRSIIPNDRMAPCSRELKINVFEEWLWRVPKPVTVARGLGPLEPHRIERMQRYHRNSNGAISPPLGIGRRIPGVYETFPLTWNEASFKPVYGGHQDIVRSWGIEPPLSYVYGFPHANCMMIGCVRQGISEWKRFWQVYPDRFARTRDWELAQRAKGGARSEKAFCRSRIGGVSVPITLAELEARWIGERKGTVDMFEECPDDQSVCFCQDF